MKGYWYRAGDESRRSSLRPDCTCGSTQSGVGCLGVNSRSTSRHFGRHHYKAVAHCIVERPAG